MPVSPPVLAFAALVLWAGFHMADLLARLS